MTIGFIEIPAGQSLQPGETMNVLLRLRKWPALEGEIHPGREWHIQEGGAVVGMGTVLQVVGT